MSKKKDLKGFKNLGVGKYQSQSPSIFDISIYALFQKKTCINLTKSNDLSLADKKQNHTQSDSNEKQTEGKHFVFIL